MKMYSFGEDARGWLRAPKHENPWDAYFKGNVWKPVYCFVFEGDELLAVVDCTEWAWTPLGHQGSYQETLEDHLRTELGKLK